jgi:polar amino acid transport system substrate-binding protein
MSSVLQKGGIVSEVKIYKTIPDILADVNAGRIQAGFADGPILAYNLQQGLFPQVRLVKSYQADVHWLGRHRRAQERRRIAEEGQCTALAKLKADGSLAKILAKWGLE